MKNKKGFTLIELLAVIVILGVLLAIAVPAVTKYINSSKKSTFITNVKEYVDSARADAVAGVYQYPVSNGQATVIRFKTIEPSLEKGGHTSSYDGTWEENNSFVVIVNEGTAEDPRNVYYVAAMDSKGYGIGTIAEGATTATAGIIEYNQLKDSNVVQLTTGATFTADKTDGSIISGEVTINGQTITVTRAY